MELPAWIGDGSAGPSSTIPRGPAFPALGEELLAAIAEGRPGTLMKAWARRHGGELTDAQIRLLVDFLRHGLHAKGA